MSSMNMLNVYDSQPAKYFALLEPWREFVVEILALLQRTSCSHVHNYLDLFFGHHGDETYAPSGDCCNIVWPQVDAFKDQIAGLQATVPFLLKVFWKRRTPTLEDTARWFLEHKVIATLEGLRLYHHKVLLEDGYDALTAYVVAYGPRAYEHHLQKERTDTSDPGDSGGRRQDGFARRSSKAVPKSKSISGPVKVSGTLPDHERMMKHPIFIRRPRLSTIKVDAALDLGSSGSIISFHQLQRLGLEDSLFKPRRKIHPSSEPFDANFIGIAILTVAVSLDEIATLSDDGTPVRKPPHEYLIYFKVVRHTKESIIIGREDLLNLTG